MKLPIDYICSNLCLGEQDYHGDCCHIEDRDYIKVVKNTKGYNWEIKLIAKPNINLIDQIAFVNQQMVNKFGVPVTGAIYDKVGEIKKC